MGIDFNERLLGLTAKCWGISRGDVVIDSDVDLVCFEMVGVESSGFIRRSVEFRAIADFLLSAERQPSGLVIEGEAGIGKTTFG